MTLSAFLLDYIISCVGRISFYLVDGANDVLSVGMSFFVGREPICPDELAFNWFDIHVTFPLATK